MKASARLDRIRVVVMDIDGVLTDGRIGYGSDLAEIKFFDVKDGLGIKLLQRAGIKAGVLSGRASLANRRRAVELGLDFVIEGAHDKRKTLETLIQKLDITAEECLYIGDDIIDIPAMKACGFSVAVADATEETREVADWVTGRPGGRGAVREMAEMLLRARGIWQSLLDPYVRES